MPTIEQNRAAWGAARWGHAGDKWSSEWGTVHMQWYGSLLPRIASFVPAPTILEIAPGFGRWTAYLKNLCQRLIIVDLNAQCIEGCRDRFAAESHISYFVNDGTSLDMVEDCSIDFIFSYDSLVHAEDAVLRGYAAQFARKLRPEGVAFIHHSNLGSFRRRVAVESFLSHIPNWWAGWIAWAFATTWYDSGAHAA